MPEQRAGSSGLDRRRRTWPDSDVPQPSSEETVLLDTRIGTAVGTKGMSSCLAGLRPLIDTGGAGVQGRTAVSRDHAALNRRHVTVVGGKLTEYRYAEDAESRHHAATPASREVLHLQPAADRRTGEP